MENLFRVKYDGSPELLDRLPQRTTLQRAIVTRLRQGGHWYNRTGWLPV